MTSSISNVNLDSTGLTIDTQIQINTNLISDWESIYGSDINLDSNTPDGQIIGIVGLIQMDNEVFGQDVYSSFDPDQAVGVVLDQRVAINGIQRQGSTFTIIPIQLTTNQIVSLSGLDSSANDPNGIGYSISDNSGNIFTLLNSITLSVGTTTVNFRAQTIGNVTIPLNTINNQVTPIIGITSVNNSAAPIQTGQDEESDAQLRLRRSQSCNNPATGFLESILGNLLALPGVTAAYVYENKTFDTDANGVPGKSVYAIVEGGSPTDIATVLYNNVSDGANFFGNTTVNITQPSGSILPVKFSLPVDVNLYLQFTIKTIVPGTSFNISAIQDYISQNLIYQIQQYAVADDSIYSVIAAAIQNTTGGGVALDLQISLDGINWTDYIPTPSLASQFVIQDSNININVI